MEFDKHTMIPVICSNNAENIIDSIKKYIKNNKTLQDIVLIEQNDKQVVLLLSDKEINDDQAAIWWSGYSEGLKVALNSDE